MKKSKKIVAFLLVLTLFSTIEPIKIEAATSPLVNLEKSEIAVEVGQSFEVPIFIKNNSGIMGLDLAVEYDKNIVSPISVVSEGILKEETINYSIETSTDNTFHEAYESIDAGEVSLIVNTKKGDGGTGDDKKKRTKSKTRKSL